MRLVCVLLLFLGAQVLAVDPEEIQSLLELYESTDGSQWFHTWPVDNTTQVCDWQGVQCTFIESADHVTGLDLYDNNLSGTLPSNFSLPWVESLIFSRNEIGGALQVWSPMDRLQELKFDNNRLVGSISVVYPEAPCEDYDFSNNYFFCPVPSWCEDETLCLPCVAGDPSPTPTPSASFTPPQPQSNLSPALWITAVGLTVLVLLVILLVASFLLARHRERQEKRFSEREQEDIFDN